MLDDADTALHLVGAALVLAIVAGLVVVGLSIANPSDDQGPDAEWTVERVDDSTVRVTHAGGGAVRTEQLRVTVDGVRRSTNWSDPVTEGDSARVPASEGSVVRVVWDGGRGERTVMERERL